MKLGGREYRLSCHSKQWFQYQPQMSHFGGWIWLNHKILGCAALHEDELISNLTGDNSRQVVSFGTEAGLFQEIGISTVVCGPGSIEQAHKIDEFIVLDELKKCLDLLDGVKNNSIPN